MKKRDFFWINRLLYFLLTIFVFALISIFNIIQFNYCYIQEEQEELQVFKRQIEWVIKPYLKTKDYKTIQKYANDFKDEDITFRIFDKNKKLLVTSTIENKGPLLSKDDKIFHTKNTKWKIYRHSIRNKKIGLIEEMEINKEKYFLELTVSEADVIKSILQAQKSLIAFFFVCILLLIWGLAQFFYTMRTAFNTLEDSVIEIANGNLDFPIEIPKIDLLVELTQSIKKMVQRLKTQITRLTQLEQYKTIFLQNITHEIKTPITAINSAIELIESRDSINNTDKECFNIIQNQTKSINKLVNDVLALSELEVKKTNEKKGFKILNLNSLIKKQIENFSHFEQEINFIKNASNVEIEGDFELLSTALSNLIMNAIRYSSSEKIDIILNKNENEVELKIKDYGIGIEEKHLNHIFERFYRVDKARSRQKGGSGLGLAIVKNIIELHEGTIEVESELNKGTTFTIKFYNQLS